MATGLPTVQGWFVHEWLWRGSSKIPQERVDDVKIVYESEDISMTQEILAKYKVEYIVIGKLEREKFEALNENKLLSLGEVVFERPEVKLIQVK